MCGMSVHNVCVRVRELVCIIAGLQKWHRTGAVFIHVCARSSEVGDRHVCVCVCVCVR